jgi:hypothetical protein
MLLVGALFALFAVGLWLYCLTDALLTPEAGFGSPAKKTWIVLIAVMFVLGAAAWLLAGRPSRYPAGRAAGFVPRGSEALGPEAEAALLRHPAGRWRLDGPPAEAGPTGPDDDPEFLRQLDSVIRNSREPGDEI